jgi:hypothetical protein
VEQVHIPDGGLGRLSLDADFALSWCALFAYPHDSKLGLILIMLHMEDRACPDRADHTLQNRSPITNVSDLGMLCEGQRLGVDTPDAHRQKRSNASIATTIHMAVFSSRLIGC